MKCDDSVINITLQLNKVYSTSK